MFEFNSFYFIFSSKLKFFTTSTQLAHHNFLYQENYCIIRFTLCKYLPDIYLAYERKVYVQKILVPFKELNYVHYL